MSVPIYGWNMCNCFSCKVHLSFLHFCWGTWGKSKWCKTRARNMCKIFSLVPSKNPVTRENWDKLSVHFSIFEWWNLQLYQKTLFGTWQFGKIGVLVNFIIQKLKSKHLACLNFGVTPCDSRAKIYISMEKMKILLNLLDFGNLTYSH